MKKINYFLTILLTLSLASGASAAEAVVSKSGVNVLKSQTQISTSTSTEMDEVKDEVSTSTTSTSSKLVTKKIIKRTALEDRKTCEVHGDLEENLNLLASTSEIAQTKLKDIKTTLIEEIEKRDNFVDGIKSFLSFKKSDVSVLSEAKVDVEDAEDYYKNLDEKVDIEKSYVADTACEKVARKEIVNHYNRVEILSKDEDKYRKDLAKKLKIKMKVLVKEVEVKKEKTKE